MKTLICWFVKSAKLKNFFYDTSDFFQIIAKLLPEYVPLASLLSMVSFSQLPYHLCHSLCLRSVNERLSSEKHFCEVFWVISYCYLCDNGAETILDISLSEIIPYFLFVPLEFQQLLFAWWTRNNFFCGWVLFQRLFVFELLALFDNANIWACWSYTE